MQVVCTGRSNFEPSRRCIVLLAFVIAVVVRYLAAQWAEKEYGNTPRANGIGWLAFFVVLIVVGLAGLSL